MAPARSPGPGAAGADLTLSISARENVAVWRVQEVGKKRKKLAAFLTNSRLDK
jgi:hypothetical protein